ncbi:MULTISPECIES: acyl-CoA dehydrogenase [Streptomyces]|uniref:acyl-CoA oxidase n=2 Tax=Streptomyces TaxID=1883 RepID=A0A652KPU5_9ACTN|nr:MULTISPECIES: acyl-CoA dehydrogenase [unclassified Streptomyces]WSS60358.1 acyl-CoA dehydrogenase family protein [Streptomyces sp. NBC_01177]WSS67465.1 acyl-CoA dehydrogenase family protein [Streptomyces sp. NBC_01175]MDX3323913.1 acyl-CoA dehydrogenase [Streptomyces sp. ME02-6979-3A]MDX3432280.1 acyl-CoA dehydrogenase [Streptomyces sp. ME01-18a]TXS25661.1 acyl-CoA oxidase [Streptomyces sp. gb1(2016)]
MATDNTSTDPSGYVQPEVDVRALTQVLDGDYAEIRDLVRTNLVTYASVLEEAEELGVDAFRERVRELVVEMAATGQTGMGFPAAYGGGGDVGASIAAFETLAFGDLSVLVKVGVQFGLFGGAILHLGTERHHDAYLPDLITGKLMGCFAMTETGHGSNVQALGTHARYDAAAQEFVITTDGDQARKDYIGNAARHAELAVVFAQLEVGGKSEGVHAFVVPVRTGGEVAPGVRIEDDGRKMGLNGVDNGRIWFDGVRVPREALLNRFADVTAEGVYESPIDNPDRRFFTMLGTLVQGRVSVGGAGVNAAKVALTIATKYAVRRRQFEAASDTEEQLLLDYGLHQRRLLPLVARTYALHFAQDVVRTQLHEVFSGLTDDEQARRRLESRAAGTKALGTWHATRVVQECREACGGAGYLAVNRFAALKADSDIFTTFEGDNHVLLQLVAKGLLTHHASEFEDLDQLGMVRYVTGLAVETVIEKTSAHKLLERVRDLLPGGDEWDQEAGLLDSEYQLAMLRYREEHMLAGVARRLKRGIDQKRNPGVVFSQVQDHVIAVAHAHVERLVLEAFVDQVRALPEGGNKVALGLLCDLFALSTIEADRAWFMEHGRLTVQRSKAISREVNDLCRKVRPLAVDLVDAWGVPAEMLRAPDLLG